MLVAVAAHCQRCWWAASAGGGADPSADLTRAHMLLRVALVGKWMLLSALVWIVLDSFSGLAAGAFRMQFGVQGAWGDIPIHLTEMAPPAFRATFPVVAYQLGNTVSSGSAEIEATGGDHLKTTIRGVMVPDNAKVHGILMGLWRGDYGYWA
ncbi:hypothetical protein C8R46DRAFT_1199159 [Mycena filopes]|nr:hypothetical protein C8R46DRAFT_1199159 [Mycena filopes]